MFCPINGRYRFQYRANGEEFRCAEPFSSELSNCPRGNGLTVRFRQCSFPDFGEPFRTHPSVPLLRTNLPL